MLTIQLTCVYTFRRKAESSVELMGKHSIKETKRSNRNEDVIQRIYITHINDSDSGKR